MGRRGSWFSAIKRVFIPNSKEKLVNGSERKGKEKKKKGLGKLRHGDASSFIPLFREPSSIEKILGEAEREQQKVNVRPPTPSEQQKAPPFVQPQAQSLPQARSLPQVQPLSQAQPLPQARPLPPRAASPRAPSPKAFHQQKEVSKRPAPTFWNHHVAAIRIQAAYRGYMARRSFRALKGLVRLQGVVRGQNVKRQTLNAMKHMQLLVRVQSQIRSRRIQMLENQALQRQALKNDKDMESSFGKWSIGQLSEADNDDWDDSMLTKEQIEARMQRKVEAVMKRERAMAYAYSHQLWKSTPRSAQGALMDFRTGGFPWWWNWLERQLPSTNPAESTQGMRNVRLTPPRPNMDQKPSPRSQAGNYRQQNLGLDNLESLTPRSSRSPLPGRTKLSQTPSPFNRFPQTQSPSLSRYSRGRASAVESTFDPQLKDDDSLTSCPPFSFPNYMTPTLSAKAKVRANGSYRLPSPSEEQKRRLSFPLTQGVGSFKWNKGSPFHGKDSPSQKMLDKDQTLQSIGNLSVDSTTSLPAGLGRKPFNRFV